MKRMFCVLLMVMGCLSFPIKADALILNGPTLTNDAIGWIDTGLSITALQDVTLESFLFNNQQAPDIIQLYDSASTTLLQTYNYAGGDPLHLVDVSWNLNSGQTYKLLAHEDSNGRWEEFREPNGDPKFPVNNEHIRLNGTVIKTQPTLLTPYWFNFTEITTEAGHNNAVPEPATMLLFSSGLLGAAFVRRRKRS